MLCILVHDEIQIAWKGSVPPQVYPGALSSSNGVGTFQWAVSHGLQFSEGLSSKVSVLEFWSWSFEKYIAAYLFTRHNYCTEISLLNKRKVQQILINQEKWDSAYCLLLGVEFFSRSIELRVIIHAKLSFLLTFTLIIRYDRHGNK